MKHHRSLIASSMCVAARLIVVSGAAQAQSLTQNVTYNKPPTIPKPPGYTQVVEANTPGRILFIAGQLGYDAAGKQGPDFRTQTTLVFENLKAAVESAGGHMDNIVKLNTHLTDIRVPLPIVRAIRDKYVHTAATPASNLLEIQKLAREG